MAVSHTRVFCVFVSKAHYMYTVCKSLLHLVYVPEGNVRTRTMNCVELPIVFMVALSCFFHQMYEHEMWFSDRIIYLLWQTTPTTTVYQVKGGLSRQVVFFYYRRGNMGRIAFFGISFEVLTCTWFSHLSFIYSTLIWDWSSFPIWINKENIKEMNEEKILIQRFLAQTLPKYWPLNWGGKKNKLFSY